MVLHIPSGKARVALPVPDTTRLIDKALEGESEIR